MSVKVINDYYIKRKAKLLTDFEVLLSMSRKILVAKFNEAKIDELFNLMKVEYENLIPEIHYVGGKKNFFTNFLIGGAAILAVIRILEKEQFTLREVGKFFYELCDINNKFRKENMVKIGKDPSQYPFEKEYRDYMKAAAEMSQKRKYPDNWVADFVDGEGKKFEWGFNVHECGIHKFLKKFDAEKYAPIICLSDFSEANIFGYGFSRTQTVSNGASICDHRYRKDIETPRAWPPDKITEFKLKL
jgi:hypothetical protein